MRVVVGEKPLAAETQRQRETMITKKSDLETVKLGIALMLSPASDEVEIGNLMEPIARRAGADDDVRAMASFLLVQAAERRKLKPFLRRDSYGRFFSCLVYLPRDRYTTSSRLAMQEVLLDELGGTGLEYKLSPARSLYLEWGRFWAFHAMEAPVRNHTARHQQLRLGVRTGW